jgi:predicted peptidase
MRMKNSFAVTLATLVVLASAARTEDNMDAVRSAFEKRTFTGTAGKELRYRLLKPEGYESASEKTYPLVIFLHGAGERGDDNEKQLVHGAKEFAKPETRQKHPCFVIAPQCPAGTSWAKIDRRGNDLAVVPSTEPTETMGLVMELIDAINKEFRIDPKRIYLTGLSMGGFGTWDLLARQPERFAAAIPICGGGLEENAPALAKLPLWVFHGAVDPVVKPQLSRRMVEALWKAGGHPGYTEYPGVAHDSWTATYRDPYVLEWLFRQHRN